MNYNIKGTNIDISPELRGYVEKKLAHVEKFAQGDPSAHMDVELEFKAEGRSKQYRAEFTLAIRGGLFRVEEWGGTMHEAIDIASAELAREIAKEKKKKVDLVRRSASRVKEYLRGLRSRP